MLARKAYDLELHYLSVLCSMQGVGGRWRFSPGESSGAARLTRCSRKPGGTVGIGSRARRDGAKRPLYSDRHAGRLLRSIALLCRREAIARPVSLVLQSGFRNRTLCEAHPHTAYHFCCCFPGSKSPRNQESLKCCRSVASGRMLQCGKRCLPLYAHRC